ncbi:hypothetical protein WJ96_04865 [Burkholderia ubonensis]|uniref:SSAP RNA binding domain-containing protein n=1 Tax=Burkholderia ubonensis TaxID=101571 RepID=A0AAW3MY29_9BURK|nr:DUF1071 domain-containing protein [Burkholderia ubonensis]KVP96560.1 hypothetical protein WJ97_11785 [Burkholderia ubonensis]KVP97905.1 hypothetical protein WJ96_04865 [Burkholderia ubonensis]KVZ92602.1 hypothetical protein WL25_16520 [Burkholderia ubonensis]
MAKTFFEALGATINEAEVAKKGGLSYIAAATAMRLAGRPEVTFVDFDGKPYLEMLNGSVVAVDIKVPGTEDVIQRMWLPVMDRDNLPLNIEKTVATDINNNRQRCLVKAIASVFGDGMSVYLGCDGDGAKAVKMLGVQPDTDLESVTPVVATLKEGGAPYIEWNVGLAACRITDPTFHWEVAMWDGKPYREVLGGLFVDVDTVYDGMRQRLSLPIMDAAFNPMPAAKASVFDWNKTVMRALTKCIAFNTGYGLSVYADEFGPDKDPKAGKGKGKATPAKTDVKAAEPAATAEAAATPAKVETPAASEVVNSGEAAVEAKVDAAVVDAAGVAAEAAEHAAAQAEAAPAVAANEAAAPTADAPAADNAPVAEAPAADAQAAAPAAEVKLPAPAAATPVADGEAVGRFREVLRKRREVGGVPGVISLFDALHTSTKFADEDKPACFAVLVTASASIVDGANIIDLLGAVTKYSAMQHLALDTRDMVAAKLTSVMLTAACAEGDEALKTAPSDLVSAGVAQDVDDVLRLAAIGNVPAETVDLLRDVLELATA